MHGKIGPDPQTRWQAAFQSTIGIVSIGGGEERRQPLLQSTMDHKGIAIHSARYLRDPQTGSQRTEYNFTPSFAVSGHRVILASTIDAARLAIDAFDTPANSEGPEHYGDRIEIHAASAEAILRASIETLVEQRMLKGGVSDASERERLDRALRELQHVERLVLEHQDFATSQKWRLQLSLK